MSKCISCKDSFAPENEDDTLCPDCADWHCSTCGYELDMGGGGYLPCAYCQPDMYEPEPRSLLGEEIARLIPMLQVVAARDRRGKPHTDELVALLPQLLEVAQRVAGVCAFHESERRRRDEAAARLEASDLADPPF